VREVAFEQAGELIDQSGARVHRAAPHGDQGRQFACHGRVLHQGGELRAMLTQQGEDHQCVGTVVFGPRRGEGAAETRAGGWMHRVNRQPRVLQ
jgi:hypothetical protein